MVDNPITRKEKYLAKLTGSYTGNVPDPITRVEKYLYDLCQKGISGLTPEEIENAVNKYLKENPVQPGATEEQAQQIKKNTDDVASLKEDLADVRIKYTNLFNINPNMQDVTISDGYGTVYVNENYIDVEEGKPYFIYVKFKITNLINWIQGYVYARMLYAVDAGGWTNVF